MKYFVYILLYILFICRHGHFFEPDEKFRYIKDKFEYAIKKLDPNLKAAKPKNDQIRIDFFNATNTKLVNFTKPHIFQLYNKTYFLLGSDIFLWANSNKLHLNKSYSLPDMEDQVTLLTTAKEFVNKNFIFTSFENDISHIYMLENVAKPVHIQSLKHKEQLTDAKFFISQYSLYLAAINTKAAILYQWHGEHFDQIHVISTKSTKFRSFSHLDLEILAFFRKTNDESTITIFQFDGSFQKIQFLKVLDCYDFEIYNIENKTFMIVLTTKDNTVYKWDPVNREFIYHTKFQSVAIAEKIIVSSIDNIHIIFFISKIDIHAYRVSANKFQYLTYLKFEEHFNIILEVIEGQKQLEIFGKQTGEDLNLLNIRYSIHYTEIVNSVSYEDPLENCLSSLQDKLDQQLNSYKNENNRNPTIAINSKRSGSTDDIELEPDFDPYELALTKLNDTIQNIQQEIVTISSKINEITNGVVNKNILVKNKLKSQYLTTNNLYVKTINDVTWTPEKWLSYSKDQIIPNEFEAKMLNSQNVEILNSTFLEDMLFDTEDITISKPVKVNNLECRHLSTNFINGINFKDIYLKSSNKPIEGLKTFDTIVVENLEAPNINYPRCNSGIDSNKFNFTPDLEVKNLNVETINSINWNEFKKYLFQRETTRKITGSLTIPSAIINTLQTTKINGVDVNDFLTKSTNQSITSKMNFNNVFARNLNVTKLHGIDFNKNIVLINSKDSVIEGPVKIKHLNATTLNIEENEMTKHYDKVKIMGDLRIKNIGLSENAKILLKGKEYNFDVAEEYWLKSTNQTIPVDVKMLNITTNKLDAKEINGVSVEDYITTDKSREKVSRNYYFKHLNVRGNIKLNQEMQHTPNWGELSESVVRRTGGYKISGEKIFDGTIIVRDAKVDYLNNFEVEKIPTIRTDDFSGYTFDTVVVKGDLTLKKTIVDAINDVETNKFFDDYKFIDREMRFEALHLGNVSINELEIEENLNAKNIPEYITKVNKIHEIKQLENVTSERNVQISIAYNVKTINGVLMELIEEAVRKGAIMAGNVTFKKDAVIENLFVTHLNDVNIPQLMRRLLYKNWKQPISGYYTFDVIRTNQLVAGQINNYNVKTLIDVTEKSPQTIKGNFVFKSVKFLDKLHGKLLCNLKKLMAFVKNPPLTKWKSITVIGNITAFTKNNLQDLVDNIVRLNQNNVINAPVTFFSKVDTHSVKSDRNVNEIDIKSIFDDALRKTEHDQLVTGHKVFSKMTCAGAHVDGNAEIPIVNGIIIKKLNESIIHKDSIHNTTVKGHKIFKSGLKATHLKTKTLSGLKPENLVNLDNLKPIPNVSFHTLNAWGNLTIDYINNNTNFREFLSNRILRNTDKEQELSGVYYFDKMELKEPSHVKKINDVPLDDIVLGNVENQKIVGSKRFSGNLKIYGNLTIDFLNNFNVTERYRGSIFRNKRSTLKGDMIFENVVEINNNISAESINGVPIGSIKEFLGSKQLRKETKEIDNVIKQIKDIVHMYYVNIGEMPQEYMYLEQSQKLQINIRNTVSAEIIENENYVLLYITGEESGQTCGLSRSCICQNQHVLQMSKDYTLQTLGSKEYERVFSFHSEKIVAHLITRTINYNRICSRKSSNESTTLTWISSNNQPKTYVKYNLIDGFITGAKFFTYLDCVYVVITRFYSSSLETHNLDCVIFKFGHKEDEIEMVQKIRTKGAWTLHLFNSHQGLILVIGNIYDSQTIISETSTEIYIFNVRSSQFELLRKFTGAGAISIADVVLDKETQIIFAQKDSPLIILKYNSVHNNFYVFQIINVESEVLSVSKFYLGGSKKDAYLNVVMENNHFYLYSYKHIEGWKLESHGKIEGLRALVPFNLNGNTHLLAPSTKLSSLLTVQKHG